MNEWKVPDWRDPAQYPRDCSLRRWAWEFLRRNPEYRAAWREQIEPSYDPTFRFQGVGLVGPAHGVPVVEQAKFMLAPADKQGALEHRHRFGLETFPPSPNDDYPPLFTGTGLCWTEEREARMSLYPGQIAVVLDLTRPIKRQMAAVRRLFAEEQKRAGHRGHRNRIELFASYLRVLDGVEAGATPTEIGAVLFFRDQSPEQQREQVRDYFDAATRLRDKDYLFIAAGAEKSNTRLVGK